MNTKNTFSVIFFIRRKKLLKNGEAPVYLRVTVRGDRIELSANTTVNPDQWNAAKAQVKPQADHASQINTYLSNLQGKVHRHKQELLDKGLEISAQNLKKAFLGKLEENMGIIELFTQHNKKCAELVGKDLAAGTLQRYETCLKHLKQYIRRNYKAQEYPVKSINHQFVQGFEHYFKTVRNCGNNSTVKYLRNFHKIIKIAINDDYLFKDPFLKMTLRLKETEREFLTDAELATILNKDFSIPRINRAKDVFVFCCFTGLAFSDVKTLTPEHIILGINGKKWIRTHRKKTKNLCEIPLLDPALKIIEKYAKDPLCQVTGNLLPVPSNQKMNLYLKELADVCGITKNITTHMARHTFATTVTLTHHVSLEAVSKMLGHSSIRTTKQYARILNTLVSDEMAKAAEIYANQEAEELPDTRKLAIK